MGRKSPQFIRLRGVRHNNLKNFDLDLPLRKLIVVTGLSGSGKSSLAFDTLFAEGQRRYIETFSPYARQFFERMDKPQVDSVEGIPPAIAIEQRNTVKTTRSTVGTMTEICDYAKVIWAQMAQLYCANCGRVVRKESPQVVWETVVRGSPRSAHADESGAENSAEVLITFDLPLSEKLSIEESLALISKQGYQRLLLHGEPLRIDDAMDGLAKSNPASLTVIQDRIKLIAENRPRFTEACEQAYHFGKGKLGVRWLEQEPLRVAHPQFFSNALHCAHCDIDYREASPALFSFNHPVGACPTCRGFGRVITIDYDRAIPDRSRTLAEGAVKPWQTGQGAECQDDLVKFCKKRRVPMDVPLEKLSPEHQAWLIEGDPGYGTDARHEWPHAWYGLKGYFRWLESKSYKMHVRVLLSRYRAYKPCPDCRGTRFKPEALLHRISVAGDSRTEPRLHIADFYRLPLQEAAKVIDSIAKQRGKTVSSDPLSIALEEARARLDFLNEVGLGYLTLDRSTRTLSGGETERVNLTTCLGSHLVNTLFVLDEPSVGLHPRDTERLIRILERLRDSGNTVLVVEHEPAVMRAADQIVDLGPGHGESGGELVFQGSYREILRAKHSLTGEYLSGRKRIDVPARRTAMIAPEAAQNGCAELRVRGATAHNLKNIAVEIPLGRFVCITGVSGSGKTTLVREVLLPLLESHLKCGLPKIKAPETAENDTGDEEQEIQSGVPEATIEGCEHLGSVLLVDQSPLGKTPRSNPAVYTGAFADIRELFARTELAQQRGLAASAFSFNSAQGQCERCRGAGFEKIEMQFLSDVFIRCPECNGRRYRSHVLEITVGRQRWSVADLLEATVDEVSQFLEMLADSRHARRAAAQLKTLQDVGLGYLRLGQPINTLSGGESQRLKLASHLAQFAVQRGNSDAAKPALFIFDEPTTGLHFDDVRVLLKVFQRLVDCGHSVLVIEHNLDVIKTADWLIDLGPEAGDQGGQVVAAGPPEAVVQVAGSHTGRALSAVL